MADVARAQLVQQLLSGGDPLQFAAGVRALGGVRTPPRATSAPQPVTGGGGSTLVVGDSLGVGTVPYLRKLLGGRVVADVKGGRSSANGIEALKRLASQGRFDRVVLDLGTNDSSAAQMLASIRRARALAPGARIVVATVNGPDAARKNAMLRNVGGGVTVVDWAGSSRGSLAGDGIHASPAGYARRARLIARSLR